MTLESLELQGEDFTQKQLESGLSSPAPPVGKKYFSSLLKRTAHMFSLSDYGLANSNTFPRDGKK